MRDHSIAPSDTVKIDMHLAAGIGPTESALILGINKDKARLAYAMRGWKIANIHPAKRIRQRKAIEQKAQDILEEEIDRSNPEHQMVLLVLCADQCGRDIHETARLSLFQREWVERIFSLWDISGIWQVTAKNIHDAEISANGYSEMTEICREQIVFLAEIMAEGSSR